MEREYKLKVSDKLERITDSKQLKEVKMAIITYDTPGILHTKCIYPPKMPDWQDWEKLWIYESAGYEISDVFWDHITWYPLAEGMTMAELETTVRQMLLQFPPYPSEVYDIHRLGAA